LERIPALRRRTSADEDGHLFEDLVIFLNLLVSEKGVLVIHQKLEVIIMLNLVPMARITFIRMFCYFLGYFFWFA
jgi:hypothetical protein